MRATVTHEPTRCNRFVQNVHVLDGKAKGKKEADGGLSPLTSLSVGLIFTRHVLCATAP